MSKFIHALTIEHKAYDENDLDGYGQPDADITTADVVGLVQPKRAQEAEDTRSAGAQIADHVIFFPKGTVIRGEDAVLQGERRYSVTGIRRYEYGGLEHLEVDARLVTPSTTAAGS